MFLSIIFLYPAHSAITIILILLLRPVRLTLPTRPTRYAIPKPRAKTLPRKVRNVLIHEKGNV
jgi:hypothetical protein